MNETMSIDREDWEVCSGDIPVMEEKITCPLMKPDMFRAFIKSRGIVKGVEGLTDRSLEEYEQYS